MAMNESGSATFHNAILIRAQHFACKICNAPGVWETNSEAYANWPGILVKEIDIRKGQSVGDICPNCNSPRALPKPLPLMKIKGSLFR